MTARPDWTRAQVEQAQRDLKRDPAAAAYWILIKARREGRGTEGAGRMNAVTLSRRLAGLALTVDRGRPTAAHWVAAMALAAQADPIPGHTRKIEFIAGRARVRLDPLPRSGSRP